MKKTLIALMAMAGVAMAVDVYSSTPYTIPGDGTEYKLDFRANEGKGLTYTIITEGAVKVSKTDAYSSANLEGSTIKLNLGGIMTVSDTWGYNFKADMKHEYDFGTAGKIEGTNQNKALEWGSASAVITLSAEFSSAELAILENKETVSRTLISVGYINMYEESLQDLDASLTLKVTGANLLDGGSLFSVTSEGITTYYSLDDVTMSGNHATLKEGATAVELASGSLYTVYGATAISGASIKTISYVATAIPEPATATLSLLALAGLAARRRRH